MDILEMASAYTATSAFSANLGAVQHGILPDFYSNLQAISEQLFSLAPDVDWSLVDNFGAGDGPTETNSSPTSRSSTLSGQGLSANRVDPINLWPDSGDSYKVASSQITPEESAGPSCLSSFSNASPDGSMDHSTVLTSGATDFKRNSAPPVSTAQTGHTGSDRARHAANQRHKRSRESRKDSHHTEISSEEPPSTQDVKASNKQFKVSEKNKFAAAKCRSRHQKQVQNIESKCNHMSAANGELKKQIRDLSGELNDLRSLALNHQTCNCPIVTYNCHQAKKVVASLQASDMERNMTRIQEV